jgi:hypothetical protein
VQIARLRHERFGRSSERLAGEVEQLELRLDEVLADIAASGGAGDAEDESASAKAPEEKAQRRGRKPLPDSLPRRDVEHLPAEGCACQSCVGALRKVGEDITEILEYRPGRFEVVRHIRPAFSRRTCEAMTHASTLLCLGQGRAAGLSGPHRGVSGRGALAPLGDGLGVQPAAGGQGAGALFRRLELGSNTRRRAG